MVRDWYTSDEKKRLEKKEQIILDWVDNPNWKSASELFHLALLDETSAGLVLRAFDTKLAEEFCRKTVYLFSYFGQRPSDQNTTIMTARFWRVVGATLGQIKTPKRYSDDRQAVDWTQNQGIFLNQVAKIRGNLTSDEQLVWIQKVLVWAQTFEDNTYLNLLGNNGVTEAIPQLEEYICSPTYSTGPRHTVEEALINGLRPVAVYNLLRLQAIQSSREKKETQEPTAA